MPMRQRGSIEPFEQRPGTVISHSGMHRDTGENFRAIFVQALNDTELSPDSLLRAVGYRQPGKIQRERLAMVCTSPVLGLDAGGYDFKYANDELVLALASVLGLDETQARDYIEAQKVRISDNRKAFKPYIWIDTAFKRSGQPIFALAAAEHFRHLWFPEEFWRKPFAQQLEEARNKVQECLKKTEGHIPLWGEIRRFLFFVRPGFAYILDLKGRVVSTWEAEARDSATMKI